MIEQLRRLEIALTNSSFLSDEERKSLYQIGRKMPTKLLDTLIKSLESDSLFELLHLKDLIREYQIELKKYAEKEIRGGIKNLYKYIEEQIQGEDMNKMQQMMSS